MLAPADLLSRRYELRRRIGAGGFSEVWEATDVVLSRAVAVKLLYAGYASDAEALARFRAEARHAGQLAHQNIARVYDYGEMPVPAPPYLVLELVDGPSLAGLLSDGPLAPARVMDIVAQTAAGLGAAHAAGLVHRDIKPANLLITPDGVVKITDFGIARALGAAPVTRTGMVVGTPAYLAPERFTGAQATPASDLYSLGVVAYECLAGWSPFRTETPWAGLALRAQPLPPLPVPLPPEVTALIGDLTAVEARARPQSAQVVADRAAGLAARLDEPSARAALAQAFTRPGADQGGPQDGQTAAPAWSVAWAPPGPRIPSGQAPPPTLAAPIGLISPTGLRAPDAPPPGGPASPRARSRTPGARRPGRRYGLVAAAAVLVAGIAGLLASSGMGPLPAHRAAALPSASSPPAPRVAALIEVNEQALAGQPVGAVARRLRAQGLTVKVRWITTQVQRPGRVVSAQRAGPRPPGGLVTITGALRPVVTPGQGRGKGHQHGAGNGHDGGKGHGHGKGQGNGQGDGDGNGDGQGDD